MKTIDPWGAVLFKDYERVIKDFGLEPFEPALFPAPNRLMRRGIVFAGRDLKIIAEAIRLKKRFYVLTGIMPSAEKIHLGTKMVIENIRYFQEHGAKAFILVADLESSATRGVSLAEARKRALDFYIPAYIALGINPKKTVFYFQSENKEVLHLAYEFSKKITLNEFKAIYGTADPSRIMSASTQARDILYPQLKEEMPGIIPVGPDQDPHIRLTRDIVKRVKSTHKFIPPSGLYNKYTPALNGELKMSKSRPEYMIELPEAIDSVCKKIRNALTGGRDTLEEHRRLGADIKKDMVFELLKQHLVEDDKALDKIYADYTTGKMTSGEIKLLACELMTKFMKEFEADLAKARKQVDNIEFIKFA